jgi:hypothetical protein
MDKENVKWGCDRMVTPQTIQNCWRYVGIIPEFTPYGSFYVVSGPKAHPHPPYQDNFHAYAPAVPVYDWHQGLHQLVQPHAHDDHAYYLPALDQLDMNLETEGIWTDQEIVDQINAERQEGFTG